MNRPSAAVIFKNSRISVCGFMFLFQLFCLTAVAKFADEAPIDANSENPRLHGLGNVIDTAYPVPTGAYFVSTGGNDATGTGSQTNPWQTIGKAVTVAPAGATIVVRGGTYRVLSLITLSKKVTIQPFPNETVWIKGSVEVNDWVQEPDQQIWRKDNWTYAFNRLSQGSPNLGACTRCIDARYPEADYRDMAFFDGKSMTQVLSLSAVTAGTFYVDNVTQKVYIGNNPAGKTVELTAAERALSVTADEVKILGLGLAHYADRAIHVNNGADRGLFEKNTFVWNALEGLGCTGVNVTFRGNNFSYNGQLGMEAGRSNQSVFENNTFRFNNVEFFRTGWAAAGIKVTDASGTIFRNNFFEKNYAHSLWLDNGIKDAIVVNNTFHNNNGQGILFEISNGAIIAGNVILGGTVGISVSGSQNAQVYNNTLVRNGIPLVVNEYIRNDIAHRYNFRVENAAFKNNIVFNATTITDGALFSITRSDCARKEPMVTALDYNAYYRSTTAQPANVVRWNPVASSCTGTFYPAFDAFRSDYPAFESHAIIVENQSENPFFIDEANGDYRLKPGSPAVNAGEALPPAVAQALGWEEGVAVNIGAKLMYEAM